METPGRDFRGPSAHVGVGAARHLRGAAPGGEGLLHHGLGADLLQD